MHTSPEYAFSVKKSHDDKAQEELFVEQAAHLLLALAGLKDLPKSQKKNLELGKVPLSNS